MNSAFKLVSVGLVILNFGACVKSWGKFWENTTAAGAINQGPIGISFPQTTYWFFQGGAITPIVPNITGTAIGCAASPGLPSGLILNTTTCAISGTPLSTQNSAGYVITVSDGRSTGMATITLRIANSSATRVYGQLGSLTSSTANNGGISANSLSGPQGITSDGSGILVTDTVNHRVFYYAASSTTASRVYGQLGSYVSGTGNNGGITANSMFTPDMVFVDNTGVYVSDFSNNRCLFYAGTATSATRVYGQLGNLTTGTANNGGINANSLSGPGGVFTDAGGFYAVDFTNNRVLFYPGTTTTATRVYGQAGSFASSAANNGGVSANSLSGPESMFVDSSGVYISDNANNRVLYFSGTSTTASRVYGQLGSFSSSAANNGGISANSLSGPQGVFADASGVYIADFGNNRVLFYPGVSTTASRVYGQAGSFASATANNGGISGNSLNGPYGVYADQTGLYVVDSTNNRILFY